MNQEPAVKIALLDDEPFTLALLGHQLDQLGYSVAAAHTRGREALDALDAGAVPPDVILLDLNMPEMDGLEFIRHLVERRYAGYLVLLTAENDRKLQAAAALVRAHQIKVLGQLHKPVTPQALAEVLGRWTPPQAAGRQRPAAASYGAQAVRAAIAGGELLNHYQPKVALADGRMVGVETLVRWQHPSDGLVFPDAFIGVAEAHGLIDSLSLVVLGAALDQARLWHDAGLDLRMAANVSMDNLSAPAFADAVADAAARAGIAPPNIVLEVTESRLMADLRAPLEVLARLSMKRFRLSIDDFGTGHSSLAQLRIFPFDELKVDRSFVHGAGVDKRLEAIFSSSLNLGRQLGMEVVAEGVENRDDWDFLRRQRCDLAQGYFIARPMPAADLPGWIDTWDARRQASTAS